MTTIQDVLDLLRTGLPPSGLTESEWLQHKVYKACGMLQEIADKQPRWISAIGHPPKAGEIYIVCDANEKIIWAEYILEETDYGQGFTHYMPLDALELPEPPEAE
jgi:hypothetical protein